MEPLNPPDPTRFEQILHSGDARVLRRVLAEDPGAASRPVLDDGDSDLPILIAARTAEPEIVLALLEAGADPNTPCTLTGLEHWSALHFAADRNAVANLRVLLDGGANPSALSADRESALHAAARADATEALQMLLTHRADPNALNCRGLAPLHITVLTGNVEAIRALIDAGANPALPTLDGRSPAELALDNAQPHAGDLLRALTRRSDLARRTRHGTRTESYDGASL